jgi:hypothetical protein
MKRCPECSRNYADQTLSFCLQDGAPLVSGEAIDEPATAILAGQSAERPPERCHTSNQCDPKPRFQELYRKVGLP